MSSSSPVVLPRVRQIFYDLTPHDLKPDDSDHIAPLQNALAYAEAAARVAGGLKREGFAPDVIVAHSGWGESMFFKDLFPNAILMHFLEAFFLAEGFYFDFGRTEPLGFEERASLRMRNLPQLAALHIGDWGLSPTKWQKQLFPEEYHSRISVIHDGINTQKLRPRDDLELVVPSGKKLRKGMEIVTFIARNLEPCRGFDSFMRAVEIVLEMRPECEVVIFGGDGVDHGPALMNGKTYRERMLNALRLDRERVHFMGRTPHSEVVSALAVSAVHVFLTYPHLISWSVLEALSSGCVVVGSATGPVMEIIDHERNGLLVDFFDYQGLARQVCEVLEFPERFAMIRGAARATVLETYSIEKNVGRQIALLSMLSAGQLPPNEQILQKRFGGTVDSKKLGLS